MKKVWFKLNWLRGCFDKVMVHDVWRINGVNLCGFDLAFSAEFHNSKKIYELGKCYLASEITKFYDDRPPTSESIVNQNKDKLKIHYINDDLSNFNILLKQPIIAEDKQNFLYYANDGFLRMQLESTWWIQGYRGSDLARFDNNYAKEIIIPTIKEYKPETMQGVDNLLSGWFGINKITD